MCAVFGAYMIRVLGMPCLVWGSFHMICSSRIGLELPRKWAHSIPVRTLCAKCYYFSSLKDGKTEVWGATYPVPVSHGADQVRLLASCASHLCDFVVRRERAVTEPEVSVLRLESGEWWVLQFMCSSQSLRRSLEVRPEMAETQTSDKAIENLSLPPLGILSHSTEHPWIYEDEIDVWPVPAPGLQQSPFRKDMDTLSTSDALSMTLTLSDLYTGASTEAMAWPSLGLGHCQAWDACYRVL